MTDLASIVGLAQVAAPVAIGITSIGLSILTDKLASKGKDKE